jgi:hypothetical protein
VQSASHANNLPTAIRVAMQISAIKAKLDAHKSLYDELDNLTRQFISLMGPDEVLVPEQAVQVGDQFILVPSQFVKIVDNFAEKNVAFKQTAIRRFDAVSESVAEREVRRTQALAKARK